MTVLCDLAYKYGTDKCPQIKHAYTPLYYEMFKDRKETVKKVVEVGIGCYESMKNNDTCYDPKLKRTYHKGASLKMWRDFFPNAQIYGADILPDAIFQEDRIKTMLCDERNKTDLIRLVEWSGSDIDIFVDDASHHSYNQIFLCKTIMPMLKKDAVYIIEDVFHSVALRRGLSEYDLVIPKLPVSKFKTGLVIVRNKI